MTKRTYPSCGAELYSADSGGVWIYECGTELIQENVAGRFL